jgi:glycosyltransferase involved in cell wall biosynthesis
MISPRVSVVIPTLRRSELLLRAVKSVLAQTMPAFELIVVVDGQDPETSGALKNIGDCRVRVIENEKSVGPGASRNAGVRCAASAWIAFLDDDDEWLPTKLERQLVAANECVTPIIIATIIHAVTPFARYVWPLRVYDNIRPFDEYLFDRRMFTKGESFLHVSSLFISRDIFDLYRFPPLRMYEDHAFLLEAVKLGKARIVTVPDPLTIVHLEEKRPSLSSVSSWRASLEWIDSVAPLIGPKAYSGFCLTTVGPQAAAAREYSAFFSILREAFSKGRPRFVQVSFFLLAWLLPIGLRRRLRRLLHNVRPSHAL